MHTDWFTRLALLAIGLLFGGYAAGQVADLVGEQAGSAPPPAAAGLPATADLDDKQKKADALAADVRTLAGPALHFRTPDKEQPPADADAAKAAAFGRDRALNLKDLATFLSDGTDPTYRGPNKGHFESFDGDKKKADEAARNIEAWFVSSAGRGEPAAAEKAWKEFETLRDKYRAVKDVASISRVTEWEVRARLHVIGKCDEWALDLFKKALEKSAPAKSPPKKQDGELTAAIEFLKVHVSQVEQLVGQLGNDTPHQEKYRKEVDRRKAWSERAALLTLLAADPRQLSRADFRGRMRMLHGLAQADDVGADLPALRKKAQFLCNAIVLQKLKLDENVVLGVKPPILRSAVTLHEKNDALIPEGGLTEDSDGLNEFNAIERVGSKIDYLKADGAQYAKEELTPTVASKLAWDYNKARAGINWSAETVRHLTTKFKELGADLNKLAEFDTEPRPGGAWDRLGWVEEAIKEYGSLFPADGK